MAPETVESETIAFSAVTDWGEHADVITKSGASYGNRIGKHSLLAEDGTEVLPMGVYVQDGIHSERAISSVATKGSKINSLTSFTVWGSLTGTNETNLFFPAEGLQFTDTDGIFHSNPAYFWPGAGTLDFVAVGNAPASGFTANLNAAGTALESFSYTVPTDATAQNDIVVASAAGISGSLNASHPLDFKHIMSAVNVKVGSYMAKGTIKSITLKGVYNSGTYNPATNRWTINTESTSDYKVKFANGDTYTTSGHASGDLINADNATFMFIPQQPGTGAVMEVVFNDGNKDYTATGSIEGDIWDMSKTTNYMLSVDESFNISIEPVGKKLDAHYIIANVNVTVTGIDNWTISATASDGKDVSILPKSEANPLAQQGFWTDKVVDENGTETETSARGTSTWSGSGEKSNEVFYVFIPENVTDRDREITITLTSSENSAVSSTKVLVQKYPHWTGDIGWEVVDDDEAGKYGFKFTRKRTYIFPYKLGNIFADYTQAEAKSIAQSIIDQNSASSYCYYNTFTYHLVTTRMYVHIDYTLLNNLSTVNNADNGYANTLELYRIGGVASTGALELAFENTFKSEEGHETERLFRDLADEGDAVPAENLTSNDMSGVIAYILKKNRYCIQTKTSGIGTTTYAYFQEKDLKWFLPAYGQFTGVDFTPEVNDDTAAQYWSSTSADGSEYAYRGDGAQESRDTELAVIAVRVNESGYASTATTVDNTSLEGGDNGSTDNWVE